MANLETQASKKKSKRPVFIALALAALFGGGGFYAVYSGLILSDSTSSAKDKTAGETKATGGQDGNAVAELVEVSFVPLPSLLVGLGMSDPPRQLRLEAHLEVAPEYVADIEKMTPRIMDIMNSYLRAVEFHDLNEPAALLRVRAQLLRRIQVAAGDGRVRDLLVTSFLIS